MTKAPRDGLIARIPRNKSRFREGVIIDPLAGRGHFGRRRDASAQLGRFGAGAAHGVIKEDRPGLDFVHARARRDGPGTVVGRPIHPAIQTRRRPSRRPAPSPAHR
jgi:restriction endonuclease Mrr